MLKINTQKTFPRLLKKYKKKLTFKPDPCQWELPSLVSQEKNIPSEEYSPAAKIDAAILYTINFRSKTSKFLTPEQKT